MKDVVNWIILGVAACLALFLQSKSRWFLWRSAVAAGLLLAAFPPSAWCQGAVPEFFGIYAVVDGKLAPLIGGRGTFTPSQISLQVYDFQRMSADTERVFVFEGGDMRFEVFDAAIADTSAGIELYKLPYARNLITRPDALAQVGGLLDQVSGRTRPGSQPQAAPASPLQRYVVARTDALKVELLQKPVPGQPQMIQLVPASNLEPGMYCLFAVRSQGGQQVIVGQLFEWKGQPGSAATPYCIDLAVTGGFGGMIDESDSRLLRPYYLAKEKYVTCRASNTSAPPPSVPPPGGGTSGGSIAPAACSDYSACFQVAMNAYRSKDWPGATAAFQSAADQRPTSGEPWIWLGRILLQDGQRHQQQDLSKVWDRALSLGAEIMIGACHERTLQPCERGDLSLTVKSVSFLANGSRAIFAAAPGEITPGSILNHPGGMHIAYSMRVAGKSYSLDFIPLGTTTCRFNLMVQCPQEGMTEQLVLAQYVSRTLPKLASGALTATLPPSLPGTPTNPAPSTSPANSACNQAVGSAYAVLLQGHLYKVRLAGPAGPDQRPFFFDEKGTQVTDPFLLPQLASAVWTHDNVIASPDARNGSNRVSGILATSKALQTYTTVQDTLARAMVEAIQAGFTGGASLGKAVPNLTLGVLRAQLLNAPKTLLTLAAQHGLEASLAAYRQMEAVPLPPQDATALNATDLARIREFYIQARSLELPYEALAAKLMPTNAGELTEQALKSALSEIAGGPVFSGTPSDAVTLRSLLDLQKAIANLATSLPALQTYSQDLNLAANLTKANGETISKWASTAGQKCN
jgi:hypothetical protein